ncbi:MAG: hypothetical protein PHE55_20560 [Methylococcaceae bacterium]|nr:hypothetical protein [Methylococcaceae bacterium]
MNFPKNLLSRLIEKRSGAFQGTITFNLPVHLHGHGERKRQADAEKAVT